MSSKIDTFKDRSTGSWRYAVGRVACLETNLLDGQQTLQLLEVDTLQHLLQLLHEQGYEGDTVDELLDNAAMADFQLLRDIAPDSVYALMLITRHDAHNLKACLRQYLPAKENCQAADLEGYMLKPYRYSAEELLALIRSRLHPENTERVDLPKFEPWLAEAIDKAALNYRNSYDLTQVDLVLDACYHRQLLALIERSDNPWVKRYFALQRDLVNLESTLRARALKLQESVLRASFLPVGRVSEQTLLALYALDGQDFGRFFTAGELSDLAALREAAELYGNPGSAARYAQMADSLLVEQLRLASRSRGPERIMAYLFAREFERRNIRLAERCLMNRIPVSRSQRLLRPTL